MNKCECCGSAAELRMGFCWECVESESVIDDGTDMYDKEIPQHPGFSKHMNKLKYILEKFNVKSK